MSKIKIFSLGGLNENGKNMYVVEVNQHIFILDAGIKYPDIDMYGVDAVIPNINYLIKNKDRIEGIFITHGHEDHISALPYLLKKIPTRVYGTHFTICLIENLLSENKMDIKNYKLFRINDTKQLKFKDVTVSIFNTTHSIPESVAIAIKTEDGPIVYCTDFNFGPTSFGKYQTSYDKITDLGKEHVLALLSESISAGSINRIKNDSLFEHAYKNILINAKGRIIVSAYSSDLNRIQKIINMSIEKGKKIAIIGRKGEKIINVAIKSNYLDIPKDSFVTLKPYEGIDTGENRNDLVVIVTGIRNEPYRLLVRMTLGEDKLIKIGPNDTTVTVCPPVPGTEKVTIDSLNTLYRYDVNAHIFDKDILRSSHADKEDLKLLYAMLKPKYIIPVKGEYRHQVMNAEIAEEVGIPKENIILKQNGDVATFVDGNLTDDIEHVNVDEILIDGKGQGDIGDLVLKDREMLGENGIVIISATLDKATKQILAGPEVLTRGFVYVKESGDLIKETQDICLEILKNNIEISSSRVDYTTIKNEVREKLGKFYYKETESKPMIITVIQEV